MSHRRHHDPVQRLNDHHGDDLLAIAQAFGGHADATAARAERVGPDGIDLALDTPDGHATVRVAFAEPAGDEDRGGLRMAVRALTRRARTALAAGGGNESSDP